MAQTSPRCPKCQKTMERGHLPDISEGHVVQTAWARGAPERRRFIGGIKVKTKEQLPLVAHRCPSCGYLELYAPDSPG
jgi:predicted nucleic-acid-binding Zn-ribbon protein